MMGRGWKGIAVCVVLALLVVLGSGLAIHRLGFATPRLWGNVVAKIAAYRQSPTDYHLLIIGDSRAFCAFQPDLLEQQGLKRVVNLAHWGVWMPAQYALLRDILPHIPPGTTLVWSIGSIGFLTGDILPNYPLGWGNVPILLKAGFQPARMAENLFLTLPPLGVLANRIALRERGDQILERPLQLGPATLDEAEQTGLPAALVGRVEMFRDQGRAVSRGVFKTNGAYLRQEIDPAFYRARQHAGSVPPYQPDPAYLALFAEILDMLKASGVRVIVNELEEAPWSYGSHQQRQQVRDWMRTTIRPQVEARGFPYVRVDFDQLTDADYFDHNHLNSQGAETFNRLMAPLLSRHMPQGAALHPQRDSSL
jgi:hypothetical protein